MAQYVSARRSFNGLTRVDMEEYFDDMEIENLYQWIDRIPLTRPKKNLAKDFSDGGKCDFFPHKDTTLVVLLQAI